MPWNAPRHTARLALLGLVLLVPAGCGDPPPRYPLLPVTGDRLELPVAAVADGAVHFFSCRLEGKTIDFFVRTDVRGELSAYFDACYSCCRYRQGYVQEGGKLVCRACRVHFDLAEGGWDFVGACTPVPLRSRLRGDILVISRDQLARGVILF